MYIVEGNTFQSQTANISTPRGNILKAGQRNEYGPNEEKYNLAPKKMLDEQNWPKNREVDLLGQKYPNKSAVFT